MELERHVLDVLIMSINSDKDMFGRFWSWAVYMTLTSPYSCIIPLEYGGMSVLGGLYDFSYLRI